jgi:hypothetical protein
MNRCLQSATLAALLLLADSNAAVAGMPSVTFSDIARMRLSTISFFAVLFLLCSLAVRLIWNSLRKDFPRLPYLSFRRAVSLVALWGLLFLLVLTMISGARELLTPGAWKKVGLTYKLKDELEPAQADAKSRLPERRAAIDGLRTALWTYARQHDGHFPADDSAPEIPDDAWSVPDPSGMRYRYTRGLRADQGDTPLAFEPGIFADTRLVLLSSGKIVSMTEAELSSATAKATR